jgi:hypothetical protein
VVREDEAAELRVLVERALSGESPAKLVVDLNRRGVPTSGGGRWRTMNLLRTLTGSFQAAVNSEGVECEWPPVVSRAQHEALLRRFPRPRSQPGRGRGPRPLAGKYPLTGLVLCDRCGASMPGSGGRYRCLPQAGGDGCCSVAAFPLEEHVFGLVYARAETWQAMQAEEEERRRAGQEQLQPLLDGIAAARARLARARDDYADGFLTREDFREVRERLDAEVWELEARASEIEVPQEPEYRFSELLQFDAEGYDERWRERELNPDELLDLRTAARGVVHAVRVEPAPPRTPVEERVRVEWRERP